MTTVAALIPEISESQRRAAWTADDLRSDRSWIYRLDAVQADELLRCVRKGRIEGKRLLDYRRGDFPFSENLLKTIGSAFREVNQGRGAALIKGLVREGVAPEEFELMTWAIGLHFGVARPQDRTSAYMNQVRDVGTGYRSPTGRGYSSRSELDFHVDSSDVVLLACYNQAPVGGMSMCTSSIKAFEVVASERPDLAIVLQSDYPFSRNGEQPPTEAPWFRAPLVGVENGRMACAWNRNRLINALKLEGVEPLTSIQSEAIGYLDAVVRRPDLMYCMTLEPGDMQLLSNQTVLHSRTRFEDHTDPERKRTLYRLWLATPDSYPLPRGWEHYSGTRLAGAVRGGSKGHRYDDACQLFDRQQASTMGMSIQPVTASSQGC